MLIIYFYMVIIKKYKVKKTFFNYFPEISGKTGINFRKLPEIFRGGGISGNLRTNNHSLHQCKIMATRLRPS